MNNITLKKIMVATVIFSIGLLYLGGPSYAAWYEGQPWYGQLNLGLSGDGSGGTGNRVYSFSKRYPTSGITIEGEQTSNDISLDIYIPDVQSSGAQMQEGYPSPLSAGAASGLSEQLADCDSYTDPVTGMILPYISEKLWLPLNATSIFVEATIGDDTVTGNVIPATSAQTIEQGTFTSEVVELESTDAYKIIQLNVYPVQYDSITQLLECADHVRVDISWDLDTSAAPAVIAGGIDPYESLMSENAPEILNNLVVDDSLIVDDGATDNLQEDTVPLSGLAYAPSEPDPTSGTPTVITASAPSVPTSYPASGTSGSTVVASAPSIPETSTPIPGTSTIVSNDSIYEGGTSGSSVSATYTINASVTPADSGTISPSGDVTVQEGADQEFVITANEGYCISSIAKDDLAMHLQGGCTTTSTEIFENVTADHRIVVSFAPPAQPPVATYTINASVTPAEGGTISPSGSVAVNAGADQEFIMNANTGYYVAAMTIDGVDIALLTSALYPTYHYYTLNDVTADHRIVASFAQLPDSTMPAATLPLSGTTPPVTLGQEDWNGVIIADIPGQTVEAGQDFEFLILDDYVANPLDILWSVDPTPVNLSVDIIAGIAIIEYTAGWTGSETISFVAYDESTDTQGSDEATFTVGSGGGDSVTVSDIPNQAITAGQTFASINLSSYAT
ncbi:MAG: hypothetical protein JW800_06805, partial [Candidatus Omnitrophica bacterium]|nr:hypothetical protein [Candidatus Omnitrophota bacterium]